MSSNMAQIDNDIIKFLRENPLSSSPEIHKGIGKGSYATVKRAIANLLENGQIVSEGQRRATRYQVSSAGGLICISMSSEKRSMILNPLDKDVPPFSSNSYPCFRKPYRTCIIQ